MKQNQPQNHFIIYRKIFNGSKKHLQVVYGSIDKNQRSEVHLGDPQKGERSTLDGWTVEKIGESKYRIKNYFQGIKASYLTCEKKGENKYNIVCLPLRQGEGKQDQQWQIQLGQCRQFQMKGKDDQWLSCVKNKISLQPCQNMDEPKDQLQWHFRPYTPISNQGQVYLAPQPDLKSPQITPKFSGQVYTPGNTKYSEVIEQYASSSYPQKLKPFLVAYPKKIDDIVFAIEYAKQKGKKVVARSGGHQYSGKSSGGDDTIVLSMDNFNKYQLVSDNIVNVQPCCPLKKVAKFFADHNITVPHGQCPLVNIGGHTQTGGYGHLLRGFGLIIDYVKSFEIVLADGTFKLVTRPQLDCNPTTDQQKLNQQLFRGVLSGNAGSYGIVTRYTFEAIRDKDHPKSYCYAKNRRYHPQVFKKLMQVVQKWTKKIQQGNEQQLRGLDFMMSIKTIALNCFFIDKCPVMNIECVYGDPDGGTPYKGQFDEIKEISESHPQLLNWTIGRFLHNIDKQLPLSQCSHAFVRHWPQVTTDGRQFSYPYKKRINGTRKPLTNQFVEEFCKKVQYLCEQQKKVNLIFQMGIGGGQTKIKGQHCINGLSVTGLPHRDILFNFVFDLFYEEGGKQRAQQIQKQMQQIVDKYFSHGQEIRLMWGSFGDTNMAKRKVMQMYYDNEEQYKVFQDLKAKVDPTDVFHTSFTIQLPGTTTDQDLQQ